MARINTGNALTTAMLQPGAKFQTDGYGLVTGTLVFREDQGGSSAFLARGQPCPISAFSFCNVHKAATSIDALGLATYTVDYVGISATDGVSSALTKCQITGSQGLTSEHITTHPNFFELASGFSGAPIAGVGASPGTKANPNFEAVAGTNPTEYGGNNGSTFESAKGRSFKGFKKAEFNDFYGKSNYLAPQTSFSGHFYTTSTGNVTGMRDRVGKTSGTNTFNSIALVPAYIGTAFVNGSKHQLLLAQVSFEDYGNLYKVSYEVRFNREGYVASVYAPA
jgi:hypothetical protein